MIMTYAAQVRNVSKSVSPQQIDDDFYDINTLRIICKYFVGSIVTLKTIDEIIEGVLYTISHNKICLTLVTVAKLDEPDKIVETAPNKLINLSDVMLIITNNNDSPEVTVKGKYIKSCQEINGNDRKSNNHKSEAKSGSKTPVSKKIEADTQETEAQGSTNSLNSTPIDSKSVENNSPSNFNKKVEEPKKVFAFNPNAPEFKPRISSAYTENINNHVIFSPHPQAFPPVFTPTSAPAIFVPNIFFYASNNVENRPFDNNNSSVENNTDVPSERNSVPDEQFIRKSMPELHIPASPFPMLPIFPPSLPIFVPNHSFKFNTLPTFSNNFDTESDVLENNELSNPSNWPPLPVPVNQGSISNCNTNGETHKSV